MCIACTLNIFTLNIFILNACRDKLHSMLPIRNTQTNSHEWPPVSLNRNGTCTLSKRVKARFIDQCLNHSECRNSFHHYVCDLRICGLSIILHTYPACTYNCMKKWVKSRVEVSHVITPSSAKISQAEPCWWSIDVDVICKHISRRELDNFKSNISVWETELNSDQ